MESNESKVVEVYIVTLKCDNESCGITSKIEGTEEKIREQKFWYRKCALRLCDGTMIEDAREVKE